MSLRKSILKFKTQLQHLYWESIAPKSVLLVDGDLHLNGQTGDFSNHNLGDDLNLPLLESLTGCHPIPLHYSFGYSRKERLLAIGSILESSASALATVWGSGFIAPPEHTFPAPRRVCAVRGPRSRQIYQSRGIQCPEIYGDPAILLPLIYKPTPKRKPEVALIPHISDWDAPFAQAWRKDGRKCLDLRNYGDWHSFIDTLCECSAIISSSLHGIILAEAYGIPCRRIKLSENINGGDFKFEDYYLSYRQTVPNTLTADAMLSQEEYIETANEAYDFPTEAMRSQLLHAFPFQQRLLPQFRQPINP